MEAEEDLERSEESRPSRLAVWSLVLGIFSLGGLAFLTGIPAIICGHMARKQLKDHPKLEGKGFALGGLVTGYLGTFLVTLLILGMVFMMWTLVESQVQQP
ncbi:MAG: DUF4190 domain-containing protein [Verrucomicrobiota bacterium]